MKTNKELAKIYQDHLACKHLGWNHFDTCTPEWQSNYAEAMQAAIAKLLESVPLEVTVDEANMAFHDGAKHWASSAGLDAVLNLCRASMAKVTASLEAKYQQELARAQKAEGEWFMLRDSLSAVMALPEKWRNESKFSHSLYEGQALRDSAFQLKQALATLQPAEVAPAPGLGDPCPECQAWHGEGHCRTRRAAPQAPEQASEGNVSSWRSDDSFIKAIHQRDAAIQRAEAAEAIRLLTPKT